MVGDVGYVSGLIDGVPDQPSIAHYIRIVRDKALLRGIIHNATAAIARAADQSEPAEVILDETESSDPATVGATDYARIRSAGRHRQEFLGSVDALLERGQRISGLATHFKRLDEMTSGLQPSDLIIVAGPPSMGKTAFAMNIAENAAMKDGKTVAVCLPGNGKGSAVHANAMLACQNQLTPFAYEDVVAGGNAQGAVGDGRACPCAHLY